MEKFRINISIIKTVNPRANLPVVFFCFKDATVNMRESSLKIL